MNLIYGRAGEDSGREGQGRAPRGGEPKRGMAQAGDAAVPSARAVRLRPIPTAAQDRGVLPDVERINPEEGQRVRPQRWKLRLRRGGGHLKTRSL
ncbi:hypothetical protein TTX_0658 [Thermoproteus tenax Kra 1]|uniref:Uncharacterized protein n=1 Tax=Thermoproteus tenax (strain ATCC 35583 / DSM 2078 / JCM 9277 / NBRC 100435 / Kra 1) TaxID=768679 RepID=G4RP24_THETK|nr:hypothetical protein TTX_0658 [Thermoproteus tenax Kra 1]